MNKVVLITIVFLLSAGLAACGNNNTDGQVKPDLTSLDLALFDAVREGNTKETLVLITRGANVNVSQRPWKMTPLAYAVSVSPELVGALIKQGADVNTMDRDGTTALMKAVHNDNLDMVKSLLKGGANPNARDKFSDTALTYAVVVGNADVIKILVSYGADINIVRTDGATPLSMAKTIVGTVQEISAPAIMKHDDSHHASHHHAPTFISRNEIITQRKNILAVLVQAGAKLDRQRPKENSNIHAHHH